MIYRNSNPKSAYDILNQIGVGTYAKVYKANRKVDSKIVAVKIVDTSNLNKAGIESILNEIRILSSISNPYIVEYYEAFVDDDDSTFWIVMEYLGGGDLLNMIKVATKNKQPFSEKQIWSYAIQMLRALKELHRLKIVHRDIKPANIFLTDDQKKVKLGDMNVSKVLRNDLAQTQIGTPYYLAPEIWNKELYDYKADVFSLGVLLFELATLKRPFEAENAIELYNKVQNIEVPRISQQYSEDLNFLTEKCMVKEQALRPSVNQLLNSRTVRRNMKEFDLEYEDSNANENCVLMQTIVPTENLSNINSQLPRRGMTRPQSSPNTRSFFGTLLDKFKHEFGDKRPQVADDKLNLIDQGLNDSPLYVSKQQQIVKPSEMNVNTNNSRNSSPNPNYHSYNNPLNANIKQRIESRMSMVRQNYKPDPYLNPHEEIVKKPPIQIQLSKNNINRPPINQKFRMSKLQEEADGQANPQNNTKKPSNPSYYQHIGSYHNNFEVAQHHNGESDRVNYQSHSFVKLNPEVQSPSNYADYLKNHLNRDVRWNAISNQGMVRRAISANRGYDYS